MGELEKIRLQVYLSRCGLGSRRVCDKLVSEGRVTVNGSKAVLGTRVGLDERICVDGKHIRLVEKSIYIAMNKPPGYLCANSDPFGRPLAVELLKKSIGKARVFHVGRLDFESSGLIFYTNDGRFAQKVSHPSKEVEKTYIVETSKAISEEMLLRYARGITIDGVDCRLKSYRLEREKRCRLVLMEGKNREIRRVFGHLGNEVRTIHRTKIGIVSLGSLQSGASRSLTQREIRWFFAR